MKFTLRPYKWFLFDTDNIYGIIFLSWIFLSDFPNNGFLNDLGFFNVLGTHPSKRSNSNQQCVFELFYYVIHLHPIKKSDPNMTDVWSVTANLNLKFSSCSAPIMFKIVSNILEASEQIWVYSLLPAASGWKYKVYFVSGCVLSFLGRNDTKRALFLIVSIGND